MGSQLAAEAVSPKHWRCNGYLINLNIGGTAELKWFRDVAKFCYPLGPEKTKDRRFFVEVEILGGVRGSLGKFGCVKHVHGSEIYGDIRGGGRLFRDLRSS